MSLSRKGAFLFAGNAINNVSSIFLMMGLAHLMTPENLGTYKQVFLVFRLASPFILAGLPSSLLYFYPQYPLERRKALLIRTYILLSMMGALLTVFTFFGSDWLARIFRTEGIAQLFQVSALYSLFYMATYVLTNVMLLQNRIKWMFGYSVSAAAIRLLIPIGAAWHGVPLRENILWLVYFEAAHWLLGLTYLLVTTKGKIFPFNVPAARDEVQYGIPLALASAIGLVAWEIDKLMIATHFSVTDYARYIVGANEIPITRMVVGVMGTLLLPTIAGYRGTDKSAHAIQLWTRATRKVALISIPIAAYAFVFAEPLISFFFGEQYADSAIFFRIYLLLIPARVANYGVLFKAFNRSNVIFRGSIYFLVFNIALNFLFIRWLGLIGPACATVVSTLGLITYYVMHLTKLFKVSFWILVPVRHHASAALVSCAAVAISWGSVHYLPLSRFAVLALSSTVFFSVFAGFCWVFGLVTKKDITALRKSSETKGKKDLPPIDPLVNREDDFYESP